MAYRQGELILASDYNTFRDTLDAVYDIGTGDSGYGQVDFAAGTALPTVAVGATIQSTEWDTFLTIAETCRSHQGSSTNFPPNSEVAVGEVVEAHEADDGNAYDINDGLIILTNNRTNYDSGAVSLFSNELNSTRNTAWSNELQHRFTATWANVDEARYFFNAGGQVRIRGSRSGGSSSTQNDSWTNMLANMGRIIIDHTSTFQSGGGPGWTINAPNIGYYDLTTSFTLLATGVPDGGGYGGYGGYPGNEVTIEARMTDGPTGGNGDNGRIMEFRIFYTDGHTNPFFDTVDGTITSDVDTQRATSPLTIPSAIFSTSIGLSSGT